jgi:hypothetical protein
MFLVEGCATIGSGIHQSNPVAEVIWKNEAHNYVGTLPASLRASLTPW